MDIQWLVLIVLVIFGVALLILAAVFSARRRRLERRAWSSPVRRDLRLISHERMAAPVSEAIEDMVKARMAADPDLKGLDLDFATSDDGGLEIWLGDERYETIESLPESRLKAYIAEAVDEYNREHGGEDV